MRINHEASKLERYSAFGGAFTITIAAAPRCHQVVWSATTVIHSVWYILNSHLGPRYGHWGEHMNASLVRTQNAAGRNEENYSFRGWFDDGNRE